MALVVETWLRESPEGCAQVNDIETASEYLGQQTMHVALYDKLRK